MKPVLLDISKETVVIIALTMACLAALTLAAIILIKGHGLSAIEFWVIVALLTVSHVTIRMLFKAIKNIFQ